MIPNRFHFVFGLKRQTQPLHLIHYLCLASCLSVNTPDAIYFYYHHEPYGRYWDLIKDKIIPIQIPPVPFIEQYHYTDRRVARYRYAHASDFIRLEKLLAQGGIYADIDTLFVNRIPQTLYNKPFVLGREADVRDPKTNQLRPSVCNAFIMAERNALFGQLWLEGLPDAFDGTWSNHSTFLPQELGTQHPDLVHIEPSRTFYKHMWTPEGLHTLLKGLDTDNKGVVSFHLWAHLWWSRWRRDFSSFHAAQVTSEYVRKVDTTYNIVARKFLPPETRSFVIPQAALARLGTERLQNTVREVGFRAYVLAKLAAFSILKEPVFPRAQEHLDYARRQWRHPYTRTRFHARNRFEQITIFDDVTFWDSYEMGQTKFAPDDVVLDIGAHVGIFSYLCYQRGSRAIYAYEPELKNFRKLAQHLGGLEGITLQNLAVVRSDEPATYTLVHSGHIGENTGGGNVLLGGQPVEMNTQELFPATTARQTTQTIALDEILEQVGHVKLLKLDCEGSEFPILLTSHLLDRVERITGEYHEIKPHIYTALDPHTRMTNRHAYQIHDLLAHLEQNGFQTSTSSKGPYLGSFGAWRTWAMK